MKKYKFLSLILVVVLLSSNFISPSAYAVTQPNTASNDVLLIDTTTGSALYAKNADSKAYPASLTKVMTVLLAVESIEAGKVSLSDQVTASKDIEADLSDDGSTSGIKPGETMTLESLLYCAMLSSANEACNIIAEYIGGDIKTFVGLMNSKAQELGCTGTHFDNTHGLPDKNHYTTANDFAKISLEAVKHPLFMQICNTVSKTIPATNLAGERTITNTNGLINNNSDMYPGYYYQYAEGVKTGHTGDAGYCLVSTAVKDGTSLMCVVLAGKELPQANGKPKLSNFTDSIMLYDWAFQNYSYREILKTTDLIKEVPVKLGKNADFVTVHPESAIRALLPNDEDNSSFEQTITIYSEQKGESLVAPISVGQELGEISVSRDGVVYGTSKLVACSAVDLSYAQSLKAKLLNTLKKPLAIVFILLVLAFFGFYFYLVIRYKRSKREYEKNQKLRRKALEKDVRADRPAPERQIPMNVQESTEKTGRKPEEHKRELVEKPPERAAVPEIKAASQKPKRVPQHSAGKNHAGDAGNRDHTRPELDYSAELQEFYKNMNSESPDGKAGENNDKNYFNDFFGNDKPGK